MIFADDLLFYLLQVVLITTCTLGMMSSLTTFKYPLKKILLIFGIYLLWVTVSTAAILYLFGFDGVVRAFLFTVSAPAIYLAYTLDENSPAQSVFIYATQIVFSLLLIMAGVCLNMEISGSKYTDLLIRVVTYGSVIYLEYRFLRKPFRTLTNVIQTGWGILSLIPVFFCFLLVMVITVPIHYLENPVSVFYVLGIIVTMLVVYFAVYQSLMHQYRLQMLSHDKAMLHLLISAMNKQADAFLAAEEKLRILRHDVRHFTELIQSGLLQGSTVQAASILSTLEAAVHDTSVKFYCDNYIINSILVSYFEQAKKEEIAVKASFTAPPDDKVNATAFSVMLANALENALDACRQKNGSRSIELKSRIFNGQYLMELSNTCSKALLFDKTGLPQSRKGEGHGIGTSSILAFAKEQEATASFLVEDGRLVLHLILGLEE